jgi:MFS transporter, PPP family, 3-phenylpropionic acid transporter
MTETIETTAPAAIPAAANNAQPRRHLLLWVLFFFQYAAIGAFFTFLNVYFSEMGLNGTQIGVMGMVGGAVSMAGAFLWGYVSDRTGRPNIWIAAGAGGALLVAQLFPLVRSAGLANPFLWYTLINAFSSVLLSAPMTLVDSTSLAMLGERSKDYGRYRMSGSVGYIVTALSVGFLYEVTGLGFMFPVYGGLMLVFAISALRLPRRAVYLVGSGLGEIGAMIREPIWLLLVGTGFLYWIAYNSSIAFTGVILKSMGASNALISFAMVIGVVVEVPLMGYSNRLLKRFGPVNLLWFAIALQVLRYFLLSRMTDPAMAIAINLLNGPGFVLFMVSMLNIITRLAPPSLLATAQGYYAGVVSLAGILSSLVSGILFDSIGQSGLFLFLSGVCLLAFLLFGVGIVLPRRLGELR